MYENLIGLMAIRKITKESIADKMSLNRGTFYNKLKGKSKFSVAEMFYIQKNFFPDVSGDVLFRQGKTTITGEEYAQ